MNKQSSIHIGDILMRSGIEWTHVPGYSGYTCNPISGCTHGCEWQMPDGTWVPCYAKTTAERTPVKRHFPGGFTNIRFHPERLKTIVKHQNPCAIFVDSMSDLMGRGVPNAWIQEVLNTMAECPQHLFQLLTKNPTRLGDFEFPGNCWVGVSAPATRMFGKELSLRQQQIWYEKALTCLGQVDATVRWTSIEPLSWDVSEIVTRHVASLDWAVIGAGTNGAKAYQPDEKILARVLHALGSTPTFFKGNLDSALALKTAGAWKEEFPLVGKKSGVKQPLLPACKIG